MNITPALVTVGAVLAAAYLWRSATLRRPRPRPREPATHLPPNIALRGVSTFSERRPIAYAAAGVASLRFPSIASMFLKVGEAHASSIALRAEGADRPPQYVKAYVDISWGEYVANATRFAKALIHIGLHRFDAVAICGFNAPSWFYAHWGTILAGGVSVGVYTTSAVDACAYITSDSGAVVAVVDTMSTATKFLKVKARCPNLRYVVVWGEPSDSPDVLSFEAFLALGDASDEECVRATAAAQGVEEAVCLIYTSGTTGSPKGVMVSSDNFLFTAASACATWRFDDKEELTVSYLPCSHVAAQVLDLALPLYMRWNGTNAIVHFARPDALRGSLSLTLKAVRPTFLFAVPRVWEKLAEGIQAATAAARPTGAKALLMEWSKRVSLRYCADRQLGGSGSRPLLMIIAERLVHHVVKSRLGLERCRRFITGAAPIGIETLTSLAAFGIDVLELYGMSESTGIGTCSTGDCFVFGACGAPYLGTEVKIDHEPGRDAVEEGEVCYRGRHVMLGYLRHQDKTDEAIDSFGWLHSGDVGRIDDNGVLRITGRIKELIITAGGENIAPVPIETELKRLMPAISNAVVIGDRRKYNVVLVTLKTRPDATGQPSDELTAEAKAVDPAATTLGQAGLSPVWDATLKALIERYNTGPVCVSNAARLQKAVVLPRELSVSYGELTDTLKIRRSVIAQNYASLIDRLYE